MKNRNIYLYIAGACFFAMCGSLWNEFVASDKSVNPNIRNSVNPNIRNSVNPKIRNSYYAVPQASVESFPFDPNEADSTQLLRLGLTPAQVRSIYRHRAKGYVYSTPEDFARTPFMTKGQWNHLKPLIKIGDQYRLLNANVNDNDNENANRSSITDNRAPITDTLGAQPRIVNSQHSNKPNAEKLAYSAEARRMSMDEIHELSIINLNESSFKDLVHHPFLSYDQVKAVKNFQRKYGRIRNMTELLILPEFTVEDTLRLSPYLQF
jgi:hypothetical protein